MSDLTRLEYFAAAALTGILANSHVFSTDKDDVSGLAVGYAVALRDAIDRFYDPDPPGEGAADA